MRKNAPEHRPTTSVTGPGASPFAARPSSETQAQIAPTSHSGHSFARVAVSRDSPSLQEPTTTPQVSPAPNRTGLPDGLKAGIEALAGLDLSGVRVHYNSDKPAQLNALAYTKGRHIHIGPGHERHLPHEAWHVVQQLQGMVRPQRTLNGEEINEHLTLENEANVMGRQALQNQDIKRNAQGDASMTAEPNTIQMQKAPGVYTVRTDTDIRSGLKSGYKPIEMLKFGTRVQVLKVNRIQYKEAELFSRVLSPNETQGWVHDELLGPDDSTTTIPGPQTSEDKFTSQVNILVSIAEQLVARADNDEQLRVSKFRRRYEEAVAPSDLRKASLRLQPDKYEELKTPFRTDSPSLIGQMIADLTNSSLGIIGDASANVSRMDWHERIGRDQSLYNQFKTYFHNPAPRPSGKQSDSVTRMLSEGFYRGSDKLT
jgi:hypothetical protein